jgi:hypothetical protein
MLSVFRHFGFDPRPFRHLTPNRLSVLAHQQGSTLVTRRRLEVNHPLHLFDRDQLSPMPRVPRLPAQLAPRRDTLGTRRCVWCIRRRWLGRVLRIPPHLFTQLGHFGLQGGDLRWEGLYLLPQGDHDRLDSRRRATPIFCCNG